MIYSSYDTKNGLWFDYKNVKIISIKEVKNVPDYDLMILFVSTI